MDSHQRLYSLEAVPFHEHHVLCFFYCFLPQSNLKRGRVKSSISDLSSDKRPQNCWFTRGTYLCRHHQNTTKAQGAAISYRLKRILLWIENGQETMAFGEITEQCQRASGQMGYFTYICHKLRASRSSTMPLSMTSTARTTA